MHCGWNANQEKKLVILPSLRGRPYGSVADLIALWVLASHLPQRVGYFSLLLASGLLLREHLLDRWPLLQLLQPSIIVRCLLLDVEILRFEIRKHGGPRDEGQIRVRALPTNQITITVLFQHRVQDLSDTLCLVLIAFNGAGEFLVVEHGEPSSLTKVGALTGHLVVEVLLGKVLFREGGEAN